MNQQTAAVADQIVALCREGENLKAVETLYAPDVVSVEAAPMGDRPATTKGLAGVREKTVWWLENHEVHEATTEGPFGHGDDRFAVIFEIDVTHKPSAQRMQLKEVGVYTVTNNKVAKEEFFYTA